MKMNEERMVWIDLETTGLEPKDSIILEVACIITDNDLKELTRFSRVISRSSATLDRKMPDGWCREQHTKSGLWALCLKSSEVLPDADSALAKLIEEHDAVGAPLCGSSAHFDRKFITHYMPKVRESLHYRNFDVSTVKQIFERWLEVEVDVPEKRDIHRGIADLEDSLALACTYRKVLRRMHNMSWS